MTSEQDVDRALIEIFRKEVQIDLSAVDRSITLGELDIPSVDMLMILYQIEDQMDVDIDPAALSPSLTLDGFKQVILEKCQSAI
jgi:acyl carrier protein